MPSIDAPVGKGQQNDTGDVLIVRLLLNKFLILGLIDDEKGDNVWPISPFGGVDDSLDKAIRAFQRQVCGFKPDGVISPGKTTFKKLNGPVSAASAAKPSAGGSSSGSISDANRAKLAEFAAQLCRQGCHYVTGGYGATPGLGDGHPKRAANAEMEKTSLSPTNPLVLAAKVANKRICKGRYQNSAVGGWKVTDKAQLKRYLDWLQELESAGVSLRPWTGFKTFKRYEGDPSIQSKIAGISPAGARSSAYLAWLSANAIKPDIFPRKVGSEILLGEDCSNRRHFDCIGFVNYCISKTWKSGWMFGYDQYKDEPAKCNAVKVNLTSGLKNGDIVLRDPQGKNPFHIGLICDNGASVANAKGQSVGTGIDSYSASKWDHARRILRY